MVFTLTGIAGFAYFRHALNAANLAQDYQVDALITQSHRGIEVMIASSVGLVISTCMFIWAACQKRSQAKS